MKQAINFGQFVTAFRNLRPDNFSYDALRLLFEYFEGLEQDTGEEIELDVIAICCDYTEDTLEDVANNFDIDLPDANDCGADTATGIVREYLQEYTQFIGVTDNGTVVYANF